MEISHRQERYKIYCHDRQSSLIAAFFQLAHLLDAGVGVDQSMRELIALEPRRALRRVWRDLERSVVDGHALSSSMARWTSVFDLTVIALLRSGEACGQLSSACLECQRYLEWQQNIKARITTVLLYPVFSLIIVVGVVGFLMVYLVPSLEGLLAVGDYNFPWHAKLLLVFSSFVKNHVLVFFSVIGSCFVLLSIAWIISSTTRIAIDGVLLRIPIYGSLYFNLLLSRYCDTCARLCDSGIELVDAMEKSEALIENRSLRIQLHNTRTSILAGKSMSSALTHIPQLSTMHIQVLCVGEATGKLVTALSRTGKQQRRISEYRIERLEKMIGPAVLLLAGFALLWIVLSLLGPVYENAIDSVILT